jgi:hypothetical protein
VSPLGLVQERVSRDLHFPWRVLACCALLNQTSKEQVRPMLGAFFAWFPEPCGLAQGNHPAVMLSLLRPLGLVNRRCHLLARMSDDYLARKSPYECFGAGQYARDALDLFCAGRTDLEPGDHWLRPYRDWRLAGGPRIRWDEADYLAWVLRK